MRGATAHRLFHFMSFWVALLEFFDADMTTPTSYGWFHLLFFALAIVMCVLLCMKYRDAEDKTVRKIIFIGWVIMAALEIYKQLNYSLDYSDTAITWDYQWYAFPYQFCSTPLYAFPLVVFLPSGKVRDAVISFLGFFSLFAGVCVFFYPNDVFISTIGINIQTMVHHGMQIVFGIFIIAHERKRLNIKFFLQGAIVFACFVLSAVVIDIIGYHALSSAGIDETFNMFFISPYFDCTLAVVNIFYGMVPYPVFLLIYIAGFSAAACVIFYLAKGILLIVEKERARVKS